ncbi:unnamed protein product [Didymodactylos carnosus]|uniref:Isochorismatase-like domain-containing protein n=1 Tax=Didymodactylos carnosus TaxID=1234261 RepID=A0A8S2U983_9BILA|nr:unnamed protein product [Didymodactylos carnosus]CAF4305173.1 unnamed protein product [Didymodactylos carnosus]
MVILCVSFRLANVEKSTEYLTKYLEKVQGKEGDIQYARACSALGFIHNTLSRYDSAIESLSEAYRISRESRHADLDRNRVLFGIAQGLKLRPFFNDHVDRMDTHSLNSKYLMTAEDLHGFVPDHNDTVLLLIDVINDMNFEGNEELIKRIDDVGKRISDLKHAAKASGIPVVYVNDNFSRWQSNFQALLEHCLEEDVPGKGLAKLLTPDKDDYFVLKPKHSGFYCTPLDILLDHFRAKSLILAGFAGNICVLFTANDAYMRGYKIYVPGDCIDSNTVEENEASLKQMEKLCKADIRQSSELIKHISKYRRKQVQKDVQESK